MGPRAWSFWVEMPISQPRPNSPPSVKRVETFTYTAAESTRARELRRVFLVPGEDAVAVAGGVLRDVPDGGVHVRHHRHGEGVVEEFPCRSPLPGGDALDDAGGLFIQPQLHRDEALRCPVIHQPLFQLRQELRRHSLVHQQHLLRVADGGTAGLGVFDDVQGLVLVGGGVHEDVADAGAGLDAGHLGVLHAAADQPRAASGDQQIHEAHRLHELIGAVVAGILHEAHQLRREPRVLKPQMDGVHDGGVGAEGLPPAAEDHRVAALQRQHRRVGGDVGAAFKDDGHHAQGHGGLLDHDAVGALDPSNHLALRVRQLHHLPHALGHAGDALRRQGQTVDHHAAVAVLRGLHVLPVGGEDVLLLAEEPFGDALQSGVLAFSGCGEGRQRGLGLPQNVLCQLHACFLPINLVPTAFPSRMS